MRDARGTVVFLAQGFSEPGGCASHGRKLAEELAARGWRVQVIARMATGRQIRRRSGPGLRLTEVPGFEHRALGGALYLLVAIPLAVLRRPPAAYVAMQLSSTATVGSLGASLHRRPFAVLSTMSGDRGEVAFVRASRCAALRRRLLRRASALVAQTDAGARELAELLPGHEHRISVVPTPVRLPDQAPPLSGEPAAVFTGRLVEQKNLATLIEAWRTVARARPEARLTLVGEGAPGDPTEDRTRAALKAQPDLAASVRITGWVADVDPYLKHADVFVFPTHFEGMSNALLEACALGRVIVASDIDANRAVLGEHYPLLFPATDAPALAACVLRAFDDDDVRHAARDQALRRVRQFDLRAVGAAIEALFSDGPPGTRR